MQKNATIVAAALSIAASLFAGEASAQQAYKIGISGAATGPASPSYLPHIEESACTCGSSTTRAASMPQRSSVIVDDKAAPSEAASSAKRLMDDDAEVLAVGPDGLSSTYAPMFQAATRTKTRSFSWARPSVRAMRPGRQNPLMFLRRQHVGPRHRRLLASPLVKALAEKNREELKLALVAADIYQPAGHRRHGGARQERERHDRRRSRRCRSEPPTSAGLPSASSQAAPIT